MSSSHQQQQPPYHQNAPHPPGPAYGYPPGPGMMPPPRRASRTGPVLAVVAVLVVLALGAGWFFVLGDDGGGDGGPGSGSEAEVELASNPDQQRLDFPDVRALRYDEGPEAACEAVSETMLARGYEFQSAKNNDGGIDCWFGTPAASSIEDGTHHFTANVYMADGLAAQPAYDAFLSAMSSNVGGGTAETTWSPLYAFPVGEEGWIVHSQDAGRGDGTASFRKGETTFYVVVYGWVERGDTDEALTEDVTFREINAIVTSLGGGEGGEPQISESMAQEYPGGIDDLGEPVLPLDGTAAELCAALTPAAAQLDVELAGPTGGIDMMGPIPTGTCRFEPTEAAYSTVDTGIRNIQFTQGDYAASDVMYPASELGSQLRHTMDRRDEDQGEGWGELYALPAGASGYFVYWDEGNGSGAMEAGWVVGEQYVTVTLGGFFNAGDYDTRALTEEELLDDLTLLLGAMTG